MIDNEIKEQSIIFAKDLVSQFKKTALDPNIRTLSDDEVKIKEELRSWGFFEKYPIETNEWDDIYISIIAMNRYKYLKHLKDNPPQPKPSKWEFVMGKMGRPNRKNR